MSKKRMKNTFNRFKFLVTQITELPDFICNNTVTKFLLCLFLDWKCYSLMVVAKWKKENTYLSLQTFVTWVMTFPNLPIYTRVSQRHVSKFEPNRIISLQISNSSEATVANSQNNGKIWISCVDKALLSDEKNMIQAKQWFD